LRSDWRGYNGLGGWRCCHAARYVGLWTPTHTAVLILIGATLAGLCGLALAIRPWLAGVRR